MVPAAIRKKSETFRISEVEKDTGLLKETLRVWERRYGFPQPRRQDDGERVYPANQVAKLRLIRRLMDAGHRPGAIVQCTLRQLNKLSREAPAALPLAEEFDGEIASIMEAVQTGNRRMLRQRLGWLLAQQGIRNFAMELLPRLNEQVGVAWLHGDISVPAEHVYSEQVASIMHGVIAGIPQEPIGPKVLLTTLPGEQHRLGLLMVEAVLSLELADCIALGTQTPISDIVNQALAMQVDVVALSFSGAFRARPALDSLAELRAALPDHIALWAGGEGIGRVRKAPPGIVMPMTLSTVAPELRRLRCRTTAPIEPAYEQDQMI